VSERTPHIEDLNYWQKTLMNRHLSRRHFLNLVGAVGGSTAIYQTSRAMGLLPETGPAPNLDLKHVGRGTKKVAILGAGISGMTVAYELERAGYDCTVIEASKRIGGRNITLRHGDVIDEMGYDQVCNFDDEPHLFFNGGPARIPGHHRRAMHYCKALGVELEIMANDNRLAYTQDSDAFDGKPVRIRHYTTDARGFMSELLYKALDRSQFEMPLSEEDHERLRQFVKVYGDLNDDGLYKGSPRAGFKTGGYGKPGVLKETLDFSEILKSSFWRRGMHFNQTEDWAAPLMTPVGGMDNIVRGFVRHLKSPIVTDAQVQGIHNTGDGVDVVYNHRGKRRKISVDYCFNSIPSHFIAGIPNNFSNDYLQALADMRRGNFFKIGFQMRERFWEREGIYGGITHTNQEINEIWYPSHGINKQKGVVLGTYAFGPDQSNKFERMLPDERLRYAAAQGDKIHKGYSDYVENGVSVPWGRMKFLMGCGNRVLDENHDRDFRRLQLPEGRHFMIGDQISYHSSWQEGAFASALNALEELDRRVRAESSASSRG